MVHRVNELGEHRDWQLWLASQGGIEMMILPLETMSVSPGVLRSPQLDPNETNTAWHREHSAQGSSAEVRHLKQAERLLNTLDLNPHRERLILDETKRTLRLFADALLSAQ